MFKCLLPEWCMLIEPQDYDLAGYYDVDESTVWEQSLKVLVESTPSDAENCYSGWTRGKVYAKGSTVCDGTVYECLDATLCSTVVPGATDSGAVWLDQTGVLSLPGSQVIDPQFFQYNFEYESGDMVISEHDKRTYKCVDLNTPATLCNDDAPFENSYWEMVSYKPSVPRITNDDGSDGGMQFPVYVDFLNSNRYVLGDYISNSNDNEVFVCQLEAFCQDDPISTVGSIGWSLTQYAVPDNSELSEPSVRFYTEYAGSTDRVQVWIEGDIALSEDGNYYFCNYAPGCRASMVGVSTTNNLEWRIYEAPTGTVFEDPECTAAQILAEEECYMMPTEVQRCVEFDAAETYTVKDIVCTPGNHDGIDFPSYDFPTQSDVTSARRYDSVWRCIDADLCSG